MKSLLLQGHSVIYAMKTPLSYWNHGFIRDARENN